MILFFIFENLAMGKKGFPTHLYPPKDIKSKLKNIFTEYLISIYDNHSILIFECLLQHFGHSLPNLCK